MEKEKVLGFLKKKGTLGVLTLCLVGAVAFATYRTGYENRKETVEERLMKEKESEKATEHVAASAGDVKAQLDMRTDYTAANELDVDPASLVSEHQLEAKQAASEQETEEAVDVASTGVEAQILPTVSFTENNQLTWPTAGTVLMDYNMSSTVYFQTLNQYKYNPALIIGSAAGNQVVASAKGIVESISVNDETGTTLVMNLGNDYTLTYGQLKEVAVAEGDVVEQGQLLGYVSEPTKYYCEEGNNLYFAMKKDGQPVDPFLYLE